MKCVCVCVVHVGKCHSPVAPGVWQSAQLKNEGLKQTLPGMILSTDLVNLASPTHDDVECNLLETGKIQGLAG